MKPGQIWFWIILATGLLGVVLVLQHHKPATRLSPQIVLPELNAREVTSVQVRPAGLGQIRAERTNGTWQLVEPFSYPAQATNVSALVKKLASLNAATFITPAEVRKRPKAEEEFGLATPQSSIIVQQGDYRAHLLIGSFTAPGDQVFLQVVAREGVYVVDADWLKLVPKSANQWRDTTLAPVHAASVDRLALTNNARTFVLQRDTNALWRMAWPLSSARADSARIDQALQHLEEVQIQEFVSDDPKPDLEPTGLAKPELELALSQGADKPILLQFGKPVPSATNQVYARKAGQNTIFTVGAAALAPWRGASVNDFRDPRLLTLTEPLAAIEVTGEESFSVARQTNGSWRVMPQGFPADELLVSDFLSALTNIQVTQFTKDVVNPPELPDFGLATPLRKYSLESPAASGAASDTPAATNCLIVELDFGRATNATDKVYVRRTDESSVYAISTNDFSRLPAAGWQLQERKLWNFTEKDVDRLLIEQPGRKRELLHKGDHLWSLAPGSQGIINDLAVEETVRGLAKASARAWVACGTEHLDHYGLDKPHRLILVLRSGDHIEIDFGGAAPNEAYYAAVKRGSETYVLELPWYLYRNVASYLSAL